jgi:hypothetical protein
MSANSFKGEFMQIIIRALALFGFLSLAAALLVVILMLRKMFKVLNYLEIEKFFTLRSFFGKEDYAFRLAQAYQQSKLTLFWKVVRYVENDLDPDLCQELVPDEAVHQANGFNLLSCHSNQASFEFLSPIADDELRVGVYRMIVKNPPPSIYEHCRNLKFAELWLLPRNTESADSS